MSYEDFYEEWPEQYQELFDEVTGSLPEMSSDEMEEAAFLFGEAFIPGEGYTWDSDFEVRGHEFFDFLGYPDEMFDWDAWREEFEAAYE